MPIILGILVVIIDQVVKLWSALVLQATDGFSIPIIKDVFNLTYMENTGAAWSFLSGQTVLLSIISTIASIVMIYIIIKYYKNMHTMLRFEALLLLAGTIGNLIDRVVLGYVRDMFDFTLINFAVFNVADAAITIGAVMLVVDFLFFRGKDLLKTWGEEDQKKALQKTDDK